MPGHLYLPQQVTPFKFAEDLSYAKFDGLSIRLDHNFRRKRLLVWIRDASETLQFPGQGLLVETFHVPLCKHFDRTLHIDLNKRRTVRLDQPSHFVTHFAIR